MDKDVEKLEPSYFVHGIVKWCNYCGKQYGSSSKIKHGITISSGNPTSGYITQRTESRVSKTNLYTHLHSINQNSQKVEET